MGLATEGSLETILIVEDDTVIRRVVHNILEQAGFGLLVAANGIEALKIESGFEATIGLLLSDIMMPDISGPDLAKKLKELRPQMRVMLMSGYPDGATLVLN